MEKLAIFELGYNLKLTIVKTNNGHHKVIEEMTEPLKIADDIESANLIKPKSIQDCIVVLKLYRKFCDTYGVTKTVAVANNLFFQAKNQKSFLEEVYNNTGVNFIVMSSDDEMKNLYLGVMELIDVSKGYIIDIQNRKTNLLKFNRRNVLATYSLDIGAISLAEKFADNVDAGAMKAYALEELDKANINEVFESDSIFIGTGPSLISLGRLAKKISHYSLELENNYKVSPELFSQVFTFTKGLDIDKTKKLKGISDDRADSLLSGFSIISAMFDKFKIPEVTISSATGTDGLISLNIEADGSDKFNDMLGTSLDNYREFSGLECENTAQVYNLAIILFKQLKVMHKLPRFYVKPLRIASSMYDAGKHIENDNYAKHGFYAVLNSGLVGASHKEIVIAAFICSCQNLDNLNLSEWMKYKDLLNEEDLDAVRKLGVIVKLATALDASRKGIVSDISCDILGDSVIMKTIVESDPTFEILQGMKVASDYKKVFKKFLQII